MQQKDIDSFEEDWINESNNYSMNKDKSFIDSIMGSKNNSNYLNANNLISNAITHGSISANTSITPVSQ